MPNRYIEDVLPLSELNKVAAIEKRLNAYR
jgi:hypothetical protein